MWSVCICVWYVFAVCILLWSMYMYLPTPVHRKGVTHGQIFFAVLQV